jgi:haloacetate dehalogenase
MGGNHAGVWAALGDPAAVHGMCEDYRVGLRIDHACEEGDRAAGRNIRCPMLLLVSTSDNHDIHGAREAIWRLWVAHELRSRPIHSGHRQCAGNRLILQRHLGEGIAASLVVADPGLVLASPPPV